ncbi:MAG TPA: hypothetical protein VKF40_28365 [Burkholderiales bacterium]|nr:hypothetical protein [Burkholderiales bacterium]
MSLRSKSVCPKCNSDCHPLFKREKTFPDADAAASYYDALLKHVVDGPAFASLIRADAKSTDQKGAVSVKTTLHRCPKCKTQIIEEKVQVHDGSEWKDADKLSRRISIPEGVDLICVFRP